MDKVVYIGAPLDYELEGVYSLDVLKIVYLLLPDLKEIRNDVVFTSKRGVIALKMNGTSLKARRVFTIGRITSDYVKRLYGLDSIFPADENSIGLARILIDNRGDYTITSSNLVSKKLVEELEENRIRYKIVNVYRIEENKNADYSILENAENLLIGSSKSFEILYLRASEKLTNKRIFAIGKPTYDTIIHYGYVPERYYEHPDIRLIVNEIVTQRI